MSEPRAKTSKEVREELLDCIHDTSEYWASLPDKTAQERCDGIAFSILSIFDGSTLDLPAFDIVVSPNPDDKQYFIDQGINWYEPGMVINDDCPLHEFWHKGE